MSNQDRGRLDRLLIATVDDFPELTRQEIWAQYHEAADRLAAKGCVEEANLLHAKADEFEEGV